MVFFVDCLKAYYLSKWGYLFNTGIVKMKTIYADDNTFD